MGVALLAGTVAAPALVWAQGASGEFAPGRILVQSKAGVADTVFHSVLAAHGGQSLGKLKGLNVHVVTLPRGQSERDTIAWLAANPNVKFAELDRRVAPSATTNDPLGSSEWHLAKVGAGTAWDSATGSGTIIAIIDSGVDGTHPDLAPQMVPGWNFWDNTSDASDLYGHGTAVAGTAAAASNNSVGVASVAWGARIMPIRISDATGFAYWSTIAQGLTWAADHGAQVANISYAVGSSATVQSAAQYMRNKGGVVVVSAGNTGAADSTAPSDTMIIVSATDANDAGTSWTTYGSFVDLAAPGYNIFTTVRGGSYGNWWGTSFSSPIVAGVAALVRSMRPDLTATQVESILFSSAADLGAPGKDQMYGYGRINAAGAVAAAKSAPTTDLAPPSVAIASPLGGTAIGPVSVSVNASDNVGVVRVDLKVNGTVVASDTTAPYAFVWDSTKVANGSTSLVAVAVDAKGNAGSSAPVALTVSNPTATATADTTPPVVAILSPTNGAKISTGNVVVSGSASDAGGLATITLAIDGVTVASGNTGTVSYRWATSKLSAGSHTIKLSATDKAGNTSSTSVSVSR